MKKAYKKIHIIFGLLIGSLVIFSQKGYSQVDLPSIEKHVAQYTTSIKFEDLDRDTITTFSYLVLYDEQSRFDTIIFSPMVDASVLSESSIDELRTKYEKLPSQVANLKNTEIFVPVLLMPHNVYYKVSMDDEGRSKAYKAWKNLFSVQDYRISKNHVQYTVPTVLTLFPTVQ